LGSNQNHEKIEIILEIEIESLALRFESFRAKNLKIQLVSILASSSKERLTSYELSLAIFQKDESKGSS